MATRLGRWQAVHLARQWARYAMRQFKVQDIVIDFVAWVLDAGICSMAILFSSLKRHLYL